MPLPLILVCELIHKAIHDVEATYASIAGQRYPVQTAPNGCRYIRYENIQFMEQNKDKASLYAKRAREGEKITWGISKLPWILIDHTGIHLPKEYETKLELA